jgi:hypothetical protein
MDGATLLGLHKTEPIEIPEYKDLGHSFTIRTLTGADRSRIMEALASDTTKDRAKAVAVMVGLSLGDKDGKRIFTDEQLPHLDALPARVLDQVATASTKFNYLSAEGLESAKKA